MKIVHLTDTYAPVTGGIERQVERLALLQAAQGHEVVVVSGRHGVGRPVARERGVLVRRPAGHTLPGRALPLHADDMDADVFHAHVSVLSPGATRAAALVHGVGLPLAVTVHSMWPTGTALPAAVVAMAGLDTDRVAWSAVSTVAAHRVTKVLSDRRVDVVPNAVDVDWWSATAAPRDREDLTAVLVGRLARRKRVLPLLRALVRDWPERLRVVIVGDGPQRQAVADLVVRAGVSDRVELVGGRSPQGVRRLLHDADVFVAPSALESFGIAALEARSAGVPVLARRGTGVGDFVRDGVDGWFAGSDEELAGGLAALVDAPPRLRELTRGARASRPVIDQAVAVRAVYALYERARSAGRRREVFPSRLRTIPLSAAAHSGGSQ